MQLIECVQGKHKHAVDILLLKKHPCSFMNKVSGIYHFYFSISFCFYFLMKFTSRHSN